MKKKILVFIILISPLYIFPGFSIAQNQTATISSVTDKNNSLPSSEAGKESGNLVTISVNSLILRLGATTERLENILNRQKSRFETINANNKKAVKLNIQLENLQKEMLTVKNELKVVSETGAALPAKPGKEEYDLFRGRVLSFKNRLANLLSSQTKFAADLKPYDLVISPTSSNNPQPTLTSIIKSVISPTPVITKITKP